MMVASTVNLTQLRIHLTRESPLWDHLNQVDLWACLWQIAFLVLITLADTGRPEVGSFIP
ncbi:hypothetical protein LEMLEM_LOCUS21575 [Lemmus lemmus]